MLPLQPRPVPRDRGLGRERDDGRNPAPRIRRRIPRLHPPRQDRGSDGRRGAAGVPPAPGVISAAEETQIRMAGSGNYASLSSRRGLSLSPLSLLFPVPNASTP